MDKFNLTLVTSYEPLRSYICEALNGMARPYDNVTSDNVTGDETLLVAYRLAQWPSGGHLMNPSPIHYHKG